MVLPVPQLNALSGGLHSGAANGLPIQVRRYSDAQVANRPRTDRKWPLNGGQFSNVRVVRVALGTVLEREIGRLRETAA